MSQQPIFGIVPAGLPLITQPAETASPTSLIYAIPTNTKSFSYIVVFLLPGVSLPENTAVAIYLVTAPGGSEQPQSRFIGGIGPGKESAIFKLSSETNQSAPGSGTVVLGIAVEEAGAVGRQLEELKASSSNGGESSSTAIVVHGSKGSTQQPSTLVLAQRIIKNAFNFLASFSGDAGGGVEVVPLKAFEGWWHKFESRIKSDPGFLERDD